MPKCRICGKPIVSASAEHDECRRELRKRLAAEVCAYHCKMAVICQDQQRLKEVYCAACALQKLIDS